MHGNGFSPQQICSICDTYVAHIFTMLERKRWGPCSLCIACNMSGLSHACRKYLTQRSAASSMQCWQCLHM